MRLVPWHDPLPPGIALHRLDLDLAAEDGDAWSDLTPDERARANRFARRADRVRFAHTRAAVRRLIAQRLACRPADVPLRADAHGKPFVEAGSDNAVPLFNISHAGDHALIALADPARVRCVGVDIEACARDLMADADALLAMAFTAREQREIRSDADLPHAFYRRWVGKEAVLKAAGVGMAEHLQSIGIHPDAHGALAVDCAVPAWAGIEAMALSAPPGYAAALAWHTKEQPL